MPPSNGNRCGAAQLSRQLSSVLDSYFPIPGFLRWSPKAFYLGLCPAPPTGHQHQPCVNQCRCPWSFQGSPPEPHPSYPARCPCLQACSHLFLGRASEDQAWALFPSLPDSFQENPEAYVKDTHWQIAQSYEENSSVSRDLILLTVR